MCISRIFHGIDRELLRMKGILHDILMEKVYARYLLRKIKKRNKFFRNFLRFIKIKIARHVFLNIFLETL